jgi:hypothetical protein
MNLWKEVSLKEHTNRMSTDSKQNKILHQTPPPPPPKKVWKYLWKTEGPCFVILPAGHSKSNIANGDGADDNNGDTKS